MSSSTARADMQKSITVDLEHLVHVYKSTPRASATTVIAPLPHRVDVLLHWLLHYLEQLHPYELSCSLPSAPVDPLLAKQE